MSRPLLSRLSNRLTSNTSHSTPRYNPSRPSNQKQKPQAPVLPSIFTRTNQFFSQLPSPNTTSLQSQISLYGNHMSNYQFTLALASQLKTKLINRPKPVIICASAALGIGQSPVASYDPVRDLGLDKLKLPELGQEIIAYGETREKSLDEWLEADAILKLNHIRRRSMLEQEASNQLKGKMTYHERKSIELGLQDKDYSPPPQRSFAESLENDFRRTTSIDSGVVDGLSQEESKALEQWMRDRDAHGIVINYLCDDIANYFKSFLVDNLADVIDDIVLYCPKLIPHYFISPLILNFLWALVPKMSTYRFLDPREYIPTKITSSLKFVSSTVRSGNLMVDLRVFYNLSMVAISTTSFALYKLTSQFPQIYNYFGYYLTYPFAWFLHHYGDSQLATHIIRASMNHEERVRMIKYNERHGVPTPSLNPRKQPPPHPFLSSVVDSTRDFINYYWNHSDPDDPNTNQSGMLNPGASPVGPRGPGGALDQARRAHQSRQPQSFINPLNPNERRENTSPRLGGSF